MPAKKTPTAAPVRAAYSRAEFCESHGISVSFYKKLLEAGLAPDELDLRRPGGVRRRPRITAEAAAEWRAKMALREVSKNG